MTPSTTIVLEERVTIAQAAELHRSLCASFANGAAIAVDGSRVGEIDTAVLQLLASLWRSCQHRGTDCVWQGASTSLRRAANLIGLIEILQFPSAESVDDGDAAA
ncbi:MAG TPA: STAS domain-containing protein [Steroidobacteraceae bacterium]|nr:STAS domain-containing protein [Steroidobacteraceae bacterium]